ncbi:MAG: zinc-dependent metalloprotease, partial [Planctomycetes bacterium]|nr:zinc-dependent metalloprotease [Planctomycetota bacterium]
NRWDLRKADSKADLSPPKKPIIFWLEKTVPFEYRKPIREGILEWNRAYEKVGFANAIEVRQQPDDATWDPEDINYNTFRWITSNAGFAMGPSRVNPTTGEILDADIIFDSDFLESWKLRHDVLTPERKKNASRRFLTSEGPVLSASGVRPRSTRGHPYCCEHSQGVARQLAFGSLMLADDGGGDLKVEMKKLVIEGLKEVVAHEVGHTLGLRHNFKGSTALTLDEMNDAEKVAQSGLSASLMDYLPANFVPKDEEQGPYYVGSLGVYDFWAIQYGYKPLTGTTEGELPELKKIASRCAEPGLDYATDEDTGSGDPDPLTNRFDLGKDPLKYAQRQVKLINQLLPGLVDRMTEEGEGYQQARRAFNVLLSYHADAMHLAARFIGGVYVYRDHKGDEGARPPYVIVEAKRQREALSFLQKEAFGLESYEFPPELYNHLASSKWKHWGVEMLDRTDYPVHELMLDWQDRVLGQLLSTTTLERLLDSELKVPAKQDAFTAADLIEGLTATVFAELESLRAGKYTNREPAIRSLRRSLQRRYLERLSLMAMGSTSAPEDCQTVAYSELSGLEAQMKKVLAGRIQLDTYTPGGGETGFFQVRVTPKESESLDVLPKDITFVVDASTSISPRKLTLTKRGIESAMDVLRPGDRFNIVVFRDSPRQFRALAIAATAENKQAAAEFLKGLESKGETDVYKAMLPVVQEAPRPGLPRIVVVISDGRPPTGMRNGRA